MNTEKTKEDNKKDVCVSAFQSFTYPDCESLTNWERTDLIGLTHCFGFSYSKYTSW